MAATAMLARLFCVLVSVGSGARVAIRPNATGGAQTQLLSQAEDVLRNDCGDACVKGLRNLFSGQPAVLNEARGSLEHGLAAAPSS
mmetsp:Transcript_17157/g.13952  ORF Transcript_17157/g.13952 Transcript_17157/m.13952 type:complete len:86 (+) Transcript_17157:121-378(+)